MNRMSEADEINELRAEVARLKRIAFRVEERRGDHSLSDRGGSLNDLYFVVTKEYENWDEGETVNWTHIEQVCVNMINELRRGE